MDFGLLFSRSWQILWRHKFLWVLGFLPGLTHVVSALLRSWLSVYVQEDLLPIFTGSTPEELLYGDKLSLAQDLLGEFFRGEALIMGIIWLFLVLFVFWLVVTLSEASIIAATLHIEDNRDISLSKSLSIGWRFIGKFIAIDAIVFFPWFVIALTAMIVAMLVLLGAAGMSVQGAAFETVMGMALIGVTCISLLCCLLIPLSFLTVQFRTLAFRDTAVFGGSAMESIKHTWQVIKANLGNVIILMMIMWGIDYLFGLVTGFISVSMGAATAVSLFSGGSGVPSLLSLAVTFLLAIPEALLVAFIGIAWTLAYLDLAEDDEKISAD